MGLLTFALNVTLDGCCGHRDMVADDEMHRCRTRAVNATRLKPGIVALHYRRRE
jgi:hypothetical protein